MKTKDVIATMLKENTGSHFLDSGDAYGRNWSRNQSRDFESEPEATLTFSVWNEDVSNGWEMDVRLSTYHFLNNALTLPSKDYQVIWEKFVKLADEDEHWFSLMQQFPGFFNFYLDQWYDSDSPPPVSLIHKNAIEYEEYAKYGTVNTYNHDSLLDQVIQYVMWEDVYGDQLALVQVHGGCDVRGGYSAPQFFKTEDYALMMDAHGEILPEDGAEFNGERVCWSTDDAYHWYYQGACGVGAGKQLEEYEASLNPSDRGNGKIYIDNDGNGYCPLTGGKLIAGIY